MISRDNFAKEYSSPSEMNISHFEVACISIHRLFRLKLTKLLSFGKYRLQSPFRLIKPESEGCVIVVDGDVKSAAVEL